MTLPNRVILYHFDTYHKWYKRRCNKNV